MEPSKLEANGDTIKLRETPKARRYVFIIRKNNEEGRVIASVFSRLPCVEIPTERILTDSSRVVIVLYKITCIETGKIYVGRAVSHILNHKKYRRYGAEGRYKSHISEAITNTKQKQCMYLNNAIRKYTPKCFTVSVIGSCYKHEADYWETKAIETYNSLFPNGYNLKLGGVFFEHTPESKERVSRGVTYFYDKQRIEKYKHIIIPVDINPDDLIRPAIRGGEQTGWYIYYRDTNDVLFKTDFAGVHIPIHVSYERAYRFIEFLQRKCE